MNNEKRIFVNTITKYINRFIFLATGFFITPYLLGHLGQERLGLYVLAYQFMAYCLLVQDSANQGVTRFATVYHADNKISKMNQALGWGFSMMLVLALISGVVIAVAARYPRLIFGVSHELSTDTTFVILICGAGAIIATIVNLWKASLFIQQKFYVTDIAGIISRLLAVFLVVLFFELYFPSILVWVSLLVGLNLLIELFFVVPIAVRSLPEMKIKPVWVGIRESLPIVNFCVMNFIGIIGWLLYFSSDSIIISNLKELGPGKIIIYNIGQRWDPHIREIVLALIVAMAPLLTKLVVSGDIEKLKKTFFRGLRYSLIIGLLPIGILYTYANEFLSIWINPSIALEAAPVLRITMLNIIFSIPMLMSYQVFIALGKIKWVALLTILGGIVNIVLSIVMVKVFDLGIWGVGLSTFITLGCKDIIFSWLFIHLYLGISFKQFYLDGVGRSFYGIVGSLVIGYALKWFWIPDNWYVLIIQFAFCFLVYSFLTYFFSLTEEDRGKLFFYKTELLNRFQS